MKEESVWNFLGRIKRGQKKKSHLVIFFLLKRTNKYSYVDTEEVFKQKMVPTCFTTHYPL